MKNENIVITLQLYHTEKQNITITTNGRRSMMTILQDIPGNLWLETISDMLTMTYEIPCFKLTLFSGRNLLNTGQLLNLWLMALLIDPFSNQLILIVGGAIWRNDNVKIKKKNKKNVWQE